MCYSGHIWIGVRKKANSANSGSVMCRHDVIMTEACMRDFSFSESHADGTRTWTNRTWNRDRERFEDTKFPYLADLWEETKKKERWSTYLFYLLENPVAFFCDLCYVCN